MANSSGFDLRGVRVQLRRPVDSSLAALWDRAGAGSILPNGRRPSQFSYFFKSILPELDGYCWVFDTSDAFNWLWEDAVFAKEIGAVLDASQSGVDSSLYVGRPGFMTELAPYVRDDWNTLLGFERPPADRDRHMALWHEDECQPALLEQVDVFLENWDAAFWVLYARRVELLERVRIDLTGVEEVCVKETTLSEMHARPR